MRAGACVSSSSLSLPRRNLPITSIIPESVLAHWPQLLSGLLSLPNTDFGCRLIAKIGNALRNLGALIPAQICYMLCGRPLQQLQADPYYCLLGMSFTRETAVASSALHRQSMSVHSEDEPGASPRGQANQGGPGGQGGPAGAGHGAPSNSGEVCAHRYMRHSGAISQMSLFASEVYEYCLSLRNPQLDGKGLMPFKLTQAQYLLDQGFSRKGERYVQLLKEWVKTHQQNTAFVAQLSVLEYRLFVQRKTGSVILNKKEEEPLIDV